MVQCLSIGSEIEPIISNIIKVGQFFIFFCVRWRTTPQSKLLALWTLNLENFITVALILVSKTVFSGHKDRSADLAYIMFSF